MKLLYDKVIKNYKVCLGKPIKVRITRDMIEVCKDNIIAHNDMVSMEKQVNCSNSCENTGDMDIIEKAHREANIIIDEAEAEARRIIKKAKEEAEKCAEEIEEARARGYNDSYNEAKMRYKSLIEETEAIREETIKEYSRILKNAETDMVNIILSIAKKVLGDEISQNKNVIFNLVKEAIDACSSKNDIVLKLSPYDYDYVIKEMDRLDSLSEGIKNLEIIKDSSLKDGDCIAETPYGCVETSMQAKVGKIENAFRKYPVLPD